MNTINQRLQRVNTKKDRGIVINGETKISLHFMQQDATFIANKTTN